jgi:hypothetical protein
MPPAASMGACRWPLRAWRVTCCIDTPENRFGSGTPGFHRVLLLENEHKPQYGHEPIEY